MRARRLAAAAAASVLLVGVAGCGGDDAETVSGGATTEAAPSEPGASESEEPAEEPAEQSGGYDADELLAAMKAAVQENETAHLVMEMAGGGQSMTAEGDVSYAGDSTSMQLTMQSPELGQGVIEVRMVDGMLYMSMPPMTPQGKFLMLDVDDPNSPFGDLGGVAQGDPMGTFKAFDEGLRDVEYLGSEDVDGEEMDHYVLTVDGKAAAEAQGSPAGSVPDEITYDLWLDGDDLMRRIQYTAADGGVTISMSDWGEPVTVTAPAKADIMQMPGS
jgi:hypothetical protein